MLSEQAEEILEALWIQSEEQGDKDFQLGANKDDPAIEELARLGYIRRDSNHIHLLEKGKVKAMGCVRRHRLAERLFTDVLDIKKSDINGVSCKFEHLLHEGLEDKVCTLLGHPKTCPHGKRIPLGRCCMERNRTRSLKFLSPLSELDLKDKGRVAYLQAKDASSMQKLIGIGVLPGVPIILLQKFPSFVFQIGHSQFAVDRELAAQIYVRLTK